MFLYKRSPRFRLSKFWMLTVCEISNNMLLCIYLAWQANVFHLVLNHYVLVV